MDFKFRFGFPPANPPAEAVLNLLRQDPGKAVLGFLRQAPRQSAVLRESLTTLAITDAILDGEIICLDPQGVSRFNWLLSARGAGQAIFYSFDLLWLNGVDLRGIPLLERKSRLAEFVRESQCQRLLYGQHIEGAGKELFAEISRRDLEGIVAKRITGLYRDDRPDWLKVKNRTHSQAEGRHALLNRTRKR